MSILCADAAGRTAKAGNTGNQEEAAGRDNPCAPGCGKGEFRQYIDEAEKELDLDIHLVLPAWSRGQPLCPHIHHSLPGTLVDVDRGVNDEMIQEFKYQGYLEPLGKM